MNKIILSITLLCLTLSAFTQEQKQIDHLKTFAKAYGYVKYFHPSDEASALDWNRFAAYGASEVIKCATNTELISTLNNLFQPIAPTIIFSDSEQSFDLKQITPPKLRGYNQTYWQHRGVSFQMNNQKGPYQSVRVNRDSEVDEAAGFGNLIMSLDAETYKGKTIKYTAWVKMAEQSKGDGHLWLRVDKSDKTMGFFENMDANPIKSTDWQQYEIIAEVDEMAAGIFLGCFLNGKGRLYIDDVHLYYKENEQWLEIPVENNGFEAAELGEKTAQSVWSGKSKGYDFGVSETDAKVGRRCGVISYQGVLKKEKGDAIFKQGLELDEHIAEDIGSGVYCQIPLSLYANSKSTYPQSTSINSLTSKLDAMDVDQTNLDLRLGNVITIYNVFQHFYPYFEEVQVDWDEQLEMALERSFIDKTAADHLISLQKFTAPLKDGHIQVWGASLGQFVPSIQWQWIQDSLVITQVDNKDLELEVGDVVTKVNGQSPEKYLEEYKSRISAGTEGWMDYRVENTSLIGSEGSELQLEVNEKPFNLKRDKAFSYNRTKIDIQDHDYKKFDSGIYYLNLNSISMDTINKLLPDLQASKGIICDLRGYPNNNHLLISYLLKKDDTTKGWMKVPKIMYPNRKKVLGYENFEWGMKAMKPHLDTEKVVFIVDGRAISYAESFMGYIEAYDLGTIVGQPTAGTNGNINPFTLLGGYGMSWTGMKVVKHDGSQHHAIGILPDVYVEKTIEGVRAGKDEFLEAAKNVILKNE